MTQSKLQNRKRILAFFLSLFIATNGFAQGNTEAKGMDGWMRSDLKMYVVTAVILIILLGIFTFLFAIERRLRKLEEKP